MTPDAGDPRSMVGPVPGAGVGPAAAETNRAGVARARDQLRCTARMHGGRCVLQAGHMGRDRTEHDYEPEPGQEGEPDAKPVP